MSLTNRAFVREMECELMDMLMAYYENGDICDDKDKEAFAHIEAARKILSNKYPLPVRKYILKSDADESLFV